MFRSVWDRFVDLDPTLVAAIMAAAVSVLTSILAVLFTPLGSYLVAKRQLRDRLKTEYEYEQRKKLRDLIGRYHGRVLHAAEEMHTACGPSTSTRIKAGCKWAKTTAK